MNIIKNKKKRNDWGSHCVNNESAETVSVERRNVMRLVFTDLLGYSTKKPDRVHRYSCKLVLMDVKKC